MDIHKDLILIIDFGSQYTQLIARRVREIGVYCEIVPYYISLEELGAFRPKGVILSGGPESVTKEKRPTIPDLIFKIGCPILGICYGMQSMVDYFGGGVKAGACREFGNALLKVIASCLLFSNLKEKEKELSVWMSHGDHVVRLPDGFRVVAETEDMQIAAIANEDKGFYGVQFHPEVTHTNQGDTILKNFIFDICKCESNWVPKRIIEKSVLSIRERVGDKHVILGLSGGVDSSVVAFLLKKAIPNQVTCIFVDTGLLRLNEMEQVKENFSKHSFSKHSFSNHSLSNHRFLKVIYVDAKEEFYKVLSGVYDPEEKRKVIGELFIKIFRREALSIKGISFLAQGTIYPDVIESAGSGFGSSKVIKTHHNVGGLPDNLPFELIEPIRELFKDEVRKIGIELGLPNEMVYRHPFPGPGLAVRILGEVKSEYVMILQKADSIFIEELNKHDYYDKVNQAFCVFLPIKSVGVMGDDRCYDYVIAIRAVETIDFMTAKWARLPSELLERVSSRIINEVNGISRVVYDVSSKPPATIEWE